MNRPRRVRRAGLAALTAAALAVPLATAAPAQAVTGTPESDNIYGFTARLDIGEGQRGCSGALVNSQWLLTAASCFADDPAAGLDVPAGKPELRTTATIGRTDLTTAKGQVRDVVELAPHDDRDLVLARLSRPVPDVKPVSLSTTAPTADETLRVAGYGRTNDEWAPLKLHTGSFTVDSVDPAEVAVTGQDGAAVCPGDTGGPAFRDNGGSYELVAVNSRSSQGGCFGIDEDVTDTGAIDTRVDNIRDWVNGIVGAVPVTDFNCDGTEDIAVGDPEATVGADADAGLVRVVHGGGKGTAEITQDRDSVPGGAEPGDRFGETMATFDHNEDGCTDLVVGIPAEDIGSTQDAGMVSILYGSPDGLTRGPKSRNFEQGKGDGAFGGSAAQAGDRMGHDVAAGHTAAGEPYLLIGVPGEDLGSVTDAGSSIYLRGGTSVAVHAGKPGVPGLVEAGDRFGTSVAASPNHLAIGAPNEAIGDRNDSGSVWAFDHIWNADGLPDPLAGIDQSADYITGAAEAGDLFGASLAMTSYRPAGADSATDSVIAVGSPGEGLTAGTDGTNRNNAGRVVALRVTADGTVDQLSDIQQEKPGVRGGAERGDRFGEKVAVVNTAPLEQSTASNLLLAAGVPGENLGSTVDTGIIQTFSPIGAPGDSDTWIEAGNAAGLPGEPGENEFMGDHIAATGTHLYVGMPNGPTARGAVHALPWPNATGGTAEPVTTYQPGQDGLPAAGKTFGWSMR